MSTRIGLVSEIDGEHVGVILFDSVTGYPLSLPVDAFMTEPGAQAFMDWLEDDPRSLSSADLDQQWKEWMAQAEAALEP